ncbi:MAG: hypothetical protein ACXW5U_18495 [Thermoanaerobaculia bacterium]
MSRPAVRQRRKSRKPPSDDPYLDIVRDQYWAVIVQAYRAYEEHRPIILVDLQEARVYAYPYPAFLADLNERSQALLVEQYREANAADLIVVFVRDNERMKLVSYSL